MNFFINATMPDHKSGIEHAELKRLTLFNKNNEAAKLVLCDWDPNGHITANQAGIQDEQIINLFDYFQEASHVATKLIQVQDIEYGVLDAQYTDDPSNSRYLVTANNQLIARVNYKQNDTRPVKSIEWFDGFNNLYCVDHYDARGFVSLKQWYTADNKIGTETWQTPTGRVVIEAFHKQTMRGDMQKTNWRLIDRQHKCQQFDTQTELITYFFDCLNEDYWSLDHPNVFVVDRSHLGDQALLQLKKPAYTAFHLHNAHTADAQNPEAPLFNNNYEFALNVIDGYDAVISATHKQTADVRTRLHPKAQLFTIPVGVVSDRLLTAPRVPLADRQFGKMVVFARIAWEKNLDDLVRAIGIVHQEVPQVTLDLYGYPDPNENYKAQHEVEAVIAEYGLEDVVTLKGYTTDIDAVQNKAMMYGLTSHMEGFNLAIMEAISHGLIAFSYDVNYGPNEIVADGVNGAVVPYGDYQALSVAILEVLRDPILAEKYMTGAYESAERYSEASVWQAWEKLLSDAQNSWATKIAAMPGYRGG